LCELFSNDRIRELIAEGWFGLRFPEQVDELCFTCLGVIKDVGLLKQLFALFAETLDQLCRMGTAYQNSPDVNV
jgi:hypothetical protein